MTPCIPPPPPLVATVHKAAALVSARVAPIDAPRVCLHTSVPARSGMATAGTVWFSFEDIWKFSRPARQWSADYHLIVLHEVLHQFGMAQGLEEVPDLNVEEGAVEAVTQDLRPVWLRRVIGRTPPTPVAYRKWVARVRRASAAATGTPWVSAAARAWRVQLVVTPPAQRPPLP